MIALFGYATPSYYLPAYVQTEGAASTSTGSTVLAVFNVGAMIGRVVLGYVSDTRLYVDLPPDTCVLDLIENFRSTEASSTHSS